MRGRRQGVRAIGVGMGVGEGDRRRLEGLPSTRALAILEARAERPLMEGFRTSRVGALEWLLGGEGDPSPLVESSPGLSLVGDVAGRLLVLPRLR